MNLTLTNPILEDHNVYHNLKSEPDWQKEFINFRGHTSETTKKAIENWVLNKKELFPSFLRMIKISPYEDLDQYDDTNSTLVGFIANTPAGMNDFHRSGFKMLLNFAISKKYEGMGIMTAAMEMVLERCYQNHFNIISAYVKPDNIGSERVLEKCGFDLIKYDMMGKTFVKALKIDTDDHKEAFGLL